mgnify:CR=1 FL=1|tara:strand:+ start:6145 stop:7689 length:1545 start_codon:yes stop_codon:yes gene_type:complete
MSLLHKKLKYSAMKYPDRYAIIHQENSLTYAKVWEIVSSFANWLSENMKRGSRIAICIENTPEVVYSLFAIPAAGMIAVPIEANIHEKNLFYILNDCNAEAMVTSGKQLDKLAKTYKNLNLKMIILCDKKNDMSQDGVSILSFDDLIKNSINSTKLDLTESNEKDTAVILYTTGTTGPKKGVRLSHFNLLSATVNINQFMQLHDGVVESLPMPLSHSFGFGRLRAVFDVGGTVILENGLIRPEWVLYNIDKYHANSFSSVPAGFEILLYGFFNEKFKEIGKNLRFIEIGSAFMLNEHKKLLIEYCPEAKICMHFGLTEASRSTFIEFHSDKNYLHTVGRSSPNVSIKVCDENGNSLADNTLGEILIKGDMVMQGYWNNYELTNKVLRNGWLHTGDLGFMDENGCLNLKGRKEDMINIGGLKVGPREVEEVLLRFDGILDVTVVGVTSPDIGNVNSQIIRAYLVVKERTKFADFQELKEFCLAEIEAYKVPREFVILDLLPKTDSGKIQRDLLEK